MTATSDEGLGRITAAAVSPTLDRWWIEQLRISKNVIVALGPRKTGKSAFFTALAERSQHVVYWSLLDGAARMQTVAEVRRELWRVIGRTAPEDSDDAGVTLKILLREALAERFDDLVLVLDDWSSAISGVSDACYEVLFDLLLFAGANQTTAPRSPAGSGSRRPVLKVVFVAELLAEEDVQYIARRTQRPAFARLSGELERLSSKAAVPFLDRDESVAVCGRLGVADADADAIAVATGGWLWLLQACTRAASAAGGWGAVDAEARRRIAAEAVQAAILPVLAERPWGGAAGSAERLPLLASQLRAGVAVRSFGIPAAYGEDGARDAMRPVPLIAELLTRRLMLVDVENIRMPFWELEDKRRKVGLITPFPPSARTVLVAHCRRWIPELCARYRIAPEDVWFVGKKDELISWLTGTSDPLPGRRLVVHARLNRKGGSDDTKLAMHVVDERRLMPLTHVVIVTDDRDPAYQLQSLGMLDEFVHFVAPWRMADDVTALLEARKMLDAGTFPVAKPRSYKDDPQWVARDAEINAHQEEARLAERSAARAAEGTAGQATPL